VARRLYAFYGGRPRLSRVLVQEALFADGDRGSRLSDQVRAFLGRLASLFEAAAARGEVRSDVSAADAALCFWSDYFTVLVAGLREPELGLRGQLRLLGGMVELRFAGLAATAARARRSR
jgi:hypothetical protein